MGLFSKNKNTINKPITSMRGRFFGIWSVGNRRYNDAYLWLIIGRIFSGMRNVRFYVDSPLVTDDAKRLLDFIDTNVNLMLWEWWSLGYIVIDYDHDGNPYFPPIEKIRELPDGSVAKYPVVIYSDKYIFSGKSDFKVLADTLLFIDRLKNADEYLTTNLGTLGIMSSKELPFSEADKEEFYTNLRNDFGITGDKKQLLLFNNPIDFKQMRLPVKELEIPEKIRDEVKMLAGYFNIPYDLIPFSGQSTFANQEQAVKQFYSECISPLAEVVLKVLRYMVVNSPISIASDRFTFTIDNVPELVDDRNTEVEYQTKVVALIKSMREQGLDTTEWERKLKNK